MAPSTTPANAASAPSPKSPPSRSSPQSPPARPSPPSGLPERGDLHSVVGKVEAIFDAFLVEDAGLSLAELARRTTLPKTTVHRICHVLTASGLLERTDGGYRLGLRLFELGQRVPRQRILRDAARPYMQELLYQSRAVIHLAILDGLDALVIERLSPYRQPTRHTQIAGRMPLHCTAVGKALLAFSPPALLTDVMRGGLPRRTPHTITSALHFTQSLERTRRDGVAIEVEEMHVGYLAVGAPILNAASLPVAAVSATATLHNTRRDHLTELVSGAATRIQQALRTAGG